MKKETVYIFIGLVLLAVLLTNPFSIIGDGNLIFEKSVIFHNILHNVKSNNDYTMTTETIVHPLDDSITTTRTVNNDVHISNDLIFDITTKCESFGGAGCQSDNIPVKSIAYSDGLNLNPSDFDKLQITFDYLSNAQACQRSNSNYAGGSYKIYLVDSSGIETKIYEGIPSSKNVQATQSGTITLEKSFVDTFTIDFDGSAVPENNDGGLVQLVGDSYEILYVVDIPKSGCSGDDSSFRTNFIISNVVVDGLLPDNTPSDSGGRMTIFFVVSLIAVGFVYFIKRGR